MSPDASAPRFAERLTFFGDSMLLTLLVGPLLGSMLGNLLSFAGLMGAGFVLGFAIGPAAGIAVAWVLRGRKPDRQMAMGAGVGTLAVWVLAGAVYALSMREALSAGSTISALVVGCLIVEITVATAMLADSLIDLARGRSHRALDVVRLVALALVAAALSVFWTNPDAAEMLAVIGPLGLAGGVAGLVCDVLVHERARTTARSGRQTPTVAG